MLLVVGCARSGTGFFASEHQLAWEFNFPSRVATTGLCSWLMGAWKQPGFDTAPLRHVPIPEGWQPTTVIHLVRHPVQCIPSLTMVAQVSREWAAQYVDVCPYLPSLQWAAEYWVAWNRMLLAQWWGVVPGDGYVVRVEELEPKRTETTYNSRPHARYTGSELANALPPLLWLQVSVLARQLGYHPYLLPSRRG